MNDAWKSFLARVWTSPLNPMAPYKVICKRFVFGEYEGGYVMGDQLGSGRFGTVREAVRGDERFAVKSIPKTAASLSDVSREIRVLTLCAHHRNVLRLVDTFETRTHWHLVTPLYSGGELFDRIIEMGSFSERDAADLAEQLLQALLFVHSRGVVHRDVKPENLLFASHAQSAPLVLVDFGMAKEYIPGVSSPMFTQCGSFSYVAPEVLNRSYTHTCDAWSAGVVLHILLTGRTPFGDGNEDEILHNVKTLPLDDSHASWRGVSQAAKDVTFGLLNRDPAKRLTVDDALKSLFFKTYVFRDNALDEARERLQEFTKYRKLKRAAIRVMAKMVFDEAEAERLRLLLGKMDKDARGRVNLSQVASATGAVPSSTSLEHAGCVDPVEIMAAAVRSSVYLRKRYLEEVFVTFDKNGDGFLDMDELRDALRGEGLEQDAVEAMRDADLNKDGLISFDEFTKVMR